MKVLDLEKSLVFYTEQMGFTLADFQPEGTDAACIFDSGSYLILLAGPGVENVASQLDDPHIVFKPGDVLARLLFSPLAQPRLPLEVRAAQV